MMNQLKEFQTESRVLSSKLEDSEVRQQHLSRKLQEMTESSHKYKEQCHGYEEKEISNKTALHNLKL
jgi:hypothetical protein